ncbi:MAG: MBL fold metallo-hydrolase [Syntrophorhabdaceae bacterium]
MGKPDFDECSWRAQVEAQNIKDLYAPHTVNGKFFNPWMPMPENSFMRLLKWKLSSKRHYTEAETKYTPAVVLNAPDRIRETQGDLILWIGHATFLMRLGSNMWLTDPMLSDRALIPRRITPPAMNNHDIAKLGVETLHVIISHNHYDHLDTETLKKLPDTTRFFVPLGLKSFITGLGKTNVTEMDWWQAVQVGDSRIVCLPAQHWSRRIGQAINSTLWASFMIISPEKTVFYGGDSGYFVGFSEIGRKFPGIDYALIPTTAYHPRWFMHYAHMDIDETIDAFGHLNARYFIPAQWGTFRLGDEPAGFPIVELKRKIRERNLDPSRFLIMDIGEILPLDNKK